jgi:hypothetical protein
MYGVKISSKLSSGRQRLRRKIFIKPDILQLGENEFLQLLLPLFGLIEAVDYWTQTLVDHCVGQVQFTQSATDPSFFFRHVGKALVGPSANYVDDILRAAPTHVSDRNFSSHYLRSSNAQTTRTYQKHSSGLRFPERHERYML